MYIQKCHLALGNLVKLVFWSILSFKNLKSKHLVCLSFLWWQVFWGNERKYSTHILGHTIKINWYFDLGSQKKHRFILKNIWTNFFSFLLLDFIFNHASLLNTWLQKWICHSIRWKKIHEFPITQIWRNESNMDFKNLQREFWAL